MNVDQSNVKLWGKYILTSDPEMPYRYNILQAQHCFVNIKFSRFGSVSPSVVLNKRKPLLYWYVYTGIQSSWIWNKSGLVRSSSRQTPAEDSLW